MLSANERPGNLSCDVFSTNHKARFHHLISSKGSPLLKFSMEVCHLVLSNMGTSLAHIDEKLHTPIERIILEIIRDLNFYVARVYRSPYLTNTDKPTNQSGLLGFVSICQIWGL